MNSSTPRHTACYTLLLTITGLLAASAVESTFDPDLICTLVVNGTKINDPRACNSWIQCIDEMPVNGTCAEGLFYDRNSEDCVASKDVVCISSDACAEMANGFTADPYTCNGYYYCKNGTGTRGECNAGLNFNPGTEACIRDYPCNFKMSPDNYCNILPDGVFIKDPWNCNGWQMCWQGEIVNGTCPDSFLFSGSLGKCDYPQNVECTFTEPPPQTAEPDYCPKVGSFVSDDRTCNGYYYCRKNTEGQMVLEHGVCPDGRFFSGDNDGACVPRTDVRCEYNRCVNMGNSTIQLANLSDDGCTGFAICQNGTTIAMADCPNGEYFNELTQLCTTQVISFKACSLSTESTTETMIDEEITTTTAT
ncbi:peritrophin-48-like [Drosophila innubila]|uniref:peritrophin-48-like n=1 Tax=Drosophila innubila TaxID=198719 RepID=UPI00148E8170|nr:peritrophin-48-like [Drosophila innubila]